MTHRFSALATLRLSTFTLIVALASCGTDVSGLDTGTREGRDTDNDSVTIDVAQPDVEDTSVGEDVVLPDVPDTGADLGPDDTTPGDVTDPDVSDAQTDADADDDVTPDVGMDVQPDVPVAPPNCGDGVVDRDEECDDANDVDTDDCTNFCTIPRCGDGVLSTEIGEVEELEPLVTNLFGVTGHVCDSGSNCPGGACDVRDVDFAAEHGICQALGHIRAISVVWGGSVGANDEVAPRAWNWGCFGFVCVEGPREGSEGACGEGNMLTSIVCESRVSEICDDGALNGEGPNQCRPGCELPVCGDGVVDDAYGEDCDDQNEIQSDGCNNCRFPSCGDGVLQPGEACDDANDDNTDGCLNICQFPICGDGIISEGEICDNGDDNGDFPDGCRNTCEPARCGDFILDTGEECDDGNDIAEDGCSNNCRLPACGDGVLQGDEECDDGNDDEFDGCSTLCLLPVCGDGVLQATLPSVDEFYDFESGEIDAALGGDSWQLDANAFEGTGALRSGNIAASQTSTLSRTVTLDEPATLSFALRVSSESCCDRFELFVNGTELQDWGGEVAWTEVTFELEPGETQIEWRYRKDGSVNTGEDAAWIDNVRLLSEAPEPEECDEGERNADEADVCRTNCTLPICTDGIIDTGEECDDGNTVQNDGCSNLCRLPACGDGVQQGGEECDDGNDDNTDACLPDCTFPVCGDGIIQVAGPVVDESFDFEDESLFGTGTWRIVPEGNGGGFAARAATIGASAESLLSWTVSLDADATLSFDRKVSSESCCDSLELRIDGALVEAWGGELDWEPVSFEVSAGEHLIEWRYEKDSSVNTGSDTAWIDNVVLVSGELRNEECDDAEDNADVADTCRTDCNLPACMDGIVDTGEECDDGNGVADDGCSNNCRLPACGDGVQQGDEECDDGNDVDTDECRSDCLAAFCGDGNIQPSFPTVNERFDFESGTLPAAFVGNWRVVNEGPDDGAVARAATIGASQESLLDWTVSLAVPATLSFDRRVSSEACCDSLEYRLDGVIVQTWQGAIDWGTVTFDIPAGDHVIRWRYEKDGSVNTGDDTAWIDNVSLISDDLSVEQCDDGEDNADVADACRTNCNVPVCMDGIVDSDEECDDGNDIADDGCSNLCILPSCGDGVTQGDEQCDDGNDDNDDECSNVCELPRCGDGILNTWTLGTRETRDFESGALPVEFMGDWRIATSGNASAFSMTNADIGDSATSGVTWAVSIASPGTLSFDRRVSSEGTYDFLRFFVNGVEVDQWTGTLDWERVSYELPVGDHTLEWRFTKDISLSAGEDAGFIDNIELNAGSPTTDTCDDGNTDDGDGCSSICQVEE